MSSTDQVLAGSHGLPHAKRHSSSLHPIIPLADTITLRCEDELCYVPPADTYKGAMEVVRMVFPHKNIGPDDHLCLMLTVTIRGICHSVRISPMTWPSLKKRLTQYEILDVISAKQAVFSTSSLEPPVHFGGYIEDFGEVYDEKQPLMAVLPPPPKLKSSNKLTSFGLTLRGCFTENSFKNIFKF